MKGFRSNRVTHVVGSALPWVIAACSVDVHYTVPLDVDGGSRRGSGGLPVTGGTTGVGGGAANGAGGTTPTASGGAQTSTGGGGAATGSGGTSNTGGARPAGGTGALGPEPDIRPPPARTGKPCAQDSECPNSLCLFGTCDDPGCGPSKGLTEICDGLDNDCDGFADDLDACPMPCRGFVANGHTYAFCGGYSYFFAEKACRAILMHAARLDSAEEIAGLVGHLPGGGPDYALWISGSDLAEPGTWRFLGGDAFWKGGAAPAGSPQNGVPSLWLEGQPNDLGMGHTQKCLTLETQGYADADCSLKKAVLCEQYNVAMTGCFDGVRDGDETDMDCGGSCAPCGVTGQRCSGNSDCRSQVCLQGVCADHCMDQTKNDSETDVDCGGSCTRCGPGRACKSDYDCGSRICTGGLCAECTTTDACPRCENSMTACCAVSKSCSCKGYLAKNCF